MAVFADQSLRKRITGADSQGLPALGLKHGDIIHIGNADVTMTSIKPKEEEAKPEAPMQIDTSQSKPEPKEPELAPDSTEPFKHISFDSHLVEMRKKCAKLHADGMKCQNCTWSQTVSYKVDFKCKKHKPYPLGMCNKCTPSAAVLNRQKYRHVDYVSFMNTKEMSSFVGHWQRQGMLEQRMAYLYGYYSEDPNYPEGVRVNVEALYEPPQMGDTNSVIELDDPKRHVVDMLASSLGLERIGWLFTKID